MELFAQNEFRKHSGCVCVSFWGVICLFVCLCVLLSFLGRAGVVLCGFGSCVSHPSRGGALVLKQATIAGVV